MAELQPEQLDQQNKRIIETLDKADLSDQERRGLAEELSTPEALKKLQAVTRDTIANSANILMSKPAGSMTEREQMIVALYMRLFPAEGLKNQIKMTDAPSKAVDEIINPDGTLKPDSLKGLSVEQIRDKFSTLNKGDLKKLIGAIDKLAGEGALKDILMRFVSPLIGEMLKSGMTLGSQEDIGFLEKNGPDDVKKAISTAKNDGILKNYQNGSSFIIRKDGSNIKIETLSADALPAGLDISKLNTVDTKKSVEALKAQLPKMDMKGLEDMVNNLLKSDNKLFRGLGELFKIFGALLGFKFDKEEKAPEATNKLTSKQKREVLTKMGKNDEYDIKNFFDSKGELIDKKDNIGFQKYLADIDKILGPGYVTKSSDGTLFIYDKLITEGAFVMQESYKVQPKSGKFDAITIKQILDKTDADGKTIEVPRAQGADTNTERAPEIKKEKHEYGDLFKSLEGKSYIEIKPLLRQSSRKLSKSQVEALQAELGFIRGNTDKSKRIDGDVGPLTVKAFLEKYKDGMKDTPSAPKK